MRDAGRDETDRAGKARGDGSVIVPAGHTLDLGMSLDHVAKAVADRAHHDVHAVDADRKGRMVHENESRTAVTLGEPLAEPGLAPGADRPTVLSGLHRVQPDQPDRKVLDRIVQEVRRLAQIGKFRRHHVAHRLAPVVVAGDDEDRHGQRGQHVGDQRVLLRAAAISEVAGDEHAIGRRIEGRDRRDGASGHGVGLEALIGHLTVGSDMEIADLGNEHRGRPAG